MTMTLGFQHPYFGIPCIAEWDGSTLQFDIEDYIEDVEAVVK